MTNEGYAIGDLVVLTSDKWKGYGGVVSWPVTREDPGYVLVCSESRIAGLRVSLNEAKPADGSYQGFTQLTYHLLKLSSHVIEKSILMNMSG